MTRASLAVGIDVGGTGIKGALADTAAGRLASDRRKVATPHGAEPEDVIAVAEQLVAEFADDPRTPVGICVPSVVVDGRTLTAANVSPRWIGLDAASRFRQALGRDVVLVNDADAAGIAEARFGAGRGVRGLVIVTTLGTGIGTALLHDGVLIPNTELGHLEIDGEDAEHRAAYSAKEREGLGWKRWAKRLQKYYAALERLFTPALFVVGGGVSKQADEFLPLLDLATPIVPAVLRNNAGILGAAWLAADARTR